MSYSLRSNFLVNFNFLQNKLGQRDATFTNISGTSYFNYLGYTTRILILRFVAFNVSTAGVGAQTAEVGFFSTPLPPNKSGQSLTKLVATGTVDSLTSGGNKRNTADFVFTCPRGVHLWSGIRTAMATTQPICRANGRSIGNGSLLWAVASGALTGAGPFTGTLPTNAADEVPETRGELV